MRVAMEGIKTEMGRLANASEAQARATAELANAIWSSIGRRYVVKPDIIFVHDFLCGIGIGHPSFKVLFLLLLSSERT